MGGSVGSARASVGTEESLSLAGCESTWCEQGHLVGSAGVCKSVGFRR